MNKKGEHGFLGVNHPVVAARHRYEKIFQSSQMTSFTKNTKNCGSTIAGDFIFGLFLAMKFLVMDDRVCFPITSGLMSPEETALRTKQRTDRFADHKKAWSGHKPMLFDKLRSIIFYVLLRDPPFVFFSAGPTRDVHKHDFCVHLGFWVSWRYPYEKKEKI